MILGGERPEGPQNPDRSANSSEGSKYAEMSVFIAPKIGSCVCVSVCVCACARTRV